MAIHPVPSEGTPTQVAHPGRAILRTFVAALVGVVLAWVVRTVGVDLAGFSDVIVDSLTAAAWAVGTGVIQWLLSHPRLQRFFEIIGLGTGVEKEGLPVARHKAD